MVESRCDVHEYSMVSQKIKEKLGLNKSPVAIKFVLREEDVPEDIREISEVIRHCVMVQKAAMGETFYATIEEQSCKGGAAALGLMDAPEKVKTGEMYHGLGRFSSL
jgi:uncharacterized protein (DUF169 family)